MYNNTLLVRLIPLLFYVIKYDLLVDSKWSYSLAGEHRADYSMYQVWEQLACYGVLLKKADGLSKKGVILSKYHALYVKQATYSSVR